MLPLLFNVGTAQITGQSIKVGLHLIAWPSALKGPVIMVDQLLLGPSEIGFALLLMGLLIVGRLLMVGAPLILDLPLILVGPSRISGTTN